MFWERKKRITPGVFVLVVLGLILNIRTGIFARPAKASNNLDLAFRHLTIEDGLSQGMVNVIHQDRKGFLWFGTKDGLNRYDGHQFTIFRNIPFDSTSLSNNHITAILEDHRGRLWIGTVDGLNCYDPATEKFRRYLHDPGNPYSLSDNNISAIRETPAPPPNNEKGISVFWIGTLNGGLNKLVLREENSAKWKLPTGMLADHKKPGANSHKSATTPQTDHYFIRYQHDAADPKSLSTNRVYDLLLDQSGVLWIGTNEGLCRLDPQYALRAGDDERLFFSRYLHHANQASSLLNNVVRSLYETGDGSIWIGTNRGLARITLANRLRGIFDNYGYFAAPALPQTENFIYEICDNHRGALWLATYKGLLIFDKQKATYQWVQHNPDNPASLSYNGLLSVFCDRSEAIWLGTAGFGLNRWDPHAKQFHTYTAKKLALDSDTELNIYALLEDRRGLMWIFTRNDWYHFDRATGRVVRHPLNFAPEQVNALLEDHAGYLWITNNSGIFRYEANSKQIKKIFPKPGEPRFKLYAIYEDSDGDMWFGSAGSLSDRSASSQHALFRWRRKTGEVKKYPLPIPENFTGGWLEIRRIIQDRSKNFWLATNYGLFHFDPAHGVLKIFHNEPHNRMSLATDELKTLLADPVQPDRFLWLGTNGGGLNRFDIATEKFSRYIEEHGLPNNVVYGILSDNAGNLWMSTNKGLSKAIVAPESREIVKFENYEIGDGLQSNEFNTNAYFKNAAGEMFFGGINGFNAFHPDSIKKNMYVPPVVITDFQVKYRSVKPGQRGSPLQKTITETQAITLSHADNIIAFEFAALDFFAPAKNLYSYKLENFDPDWSQPRPNHRAIYTNLSPGEYVFRVRASNNDGVWNEIGATLAITITPYFYETRWFAALGLLMLGLTLYGGYRWRLRHLEAGRQALERLVAEKTAHLHKSEELYRTLYNNTPVMMHSINTKGELLNVNDYWLRVLDYEREEVIGAQVANYLSAASRQYDTNVTIPAFFRTGEIKNIEYQFVKKSGEMIDVVLNGIAIRDERGEIDRSLAFSVDVTEQKRIEKALRQVESFRLITEALPVALIIMRLADGVILFANRHVESVVGLSNFEMTGRNAADFFADPAERTKILALLEQNDNINNYELKIKRADGTLNWGLFSGIKIDFDGTPALLVGYHDITARKEAETTIRESEHRYRVLFEEAPTPLWQIDMSRVKKLLEGWRGEGIDNFREFFDEHPLAVEQCLWAINILDVNDAVVQLYRANSKQHLILSVWQIWSSESINIFREQLIAIAEGKTENQFEVSTQTLEGKKIHLWGQWHIMPDYEQSLSKVFISKINITQRKEYLDELQASRERLRALGAHLQSLREQERLAVARDLHDELGQALTALKMDLSMLERKAQNTKAKLDGSIVIREIRSMQQRVSNTIKKVRNLIKELRPEVLDTLGLLPALEWQVEEFHKRSGLLCKFHSEIKGLDIAKEHAIAIFRIFQESLTNIARHAGASEVKVNVNARDHAFWIEIADNGIGIPAEALNAPGKFGLLGMRERAMVFGGEVVIAGISGYGTTVTIKVPMPG